MKHLPRIFSMLLTFLLIVNAAACGNDPPSEAGTEVQIEAESLNEDGQETTAETERFVEETVIEPELPDKTYTGAEVNVLSRIATIVGYIPYEISTDEMNGEALNDAIYERNAKIEEQFDISINDKASAAPSSEIALLIRSQDDTYCFFTDTLQLIGNMLLQKQLFNIEEIPYIDLEKPWWDSRAMSDLALFNKCIWACRTCL